MKKKILVLILAIITIIPMGCALRRDTMENITIYTSSYPIEYITNSLYGKYSKVESIYPYGINNNTYELTDEQIKLYGSEASLFIFNGIDKEKDYVGKMLAYNKKLKIIDSTKSIDYEYGDAELWLNPSNVLMMAKNIKEGFYEYVSNQYLRNNISTNYDDLKLKISKLESKIYFTVETSDNKNIVVANNSLKFLEKYGLTVYSLDEDTISDKTIETIKSVISKNKISYIYSLDEEDTDTVKSFKDNYKLQVLKVNDLSNLSENDRKNNRDYISVMNDNIDLLRKEIYNN
jgi:zinc transport system substrate-binding protein